jgi:hypothetical protein
MEKSAVLKPIPTASDSTATTAKPGFRASHLTAYRTSDRRELIIGSLQSPFTAGDPWRFISDIKAAP